MAKLYFNYSTMGAGKSAQLLQAAHNYESNGSEVLYFNFKMDERFGKNKIASRIGLEHSANMFDNDFNFLEFVSERVDINPAAIFIDECQFLTTAQVHQLIEIVDNLKIPVLCYGLRNSYNGNLFEGSEALMCNADVITEIKSMCSNQKCSKKATHNALFIDQKRVNVGNQLHIGDTEYKPLCRNHFYEHIK